MGSKGILEAFSLGGECTTSPCGMENHVKVCLQGENSGVASHPISKTIDVNNSH